MDSNGNNNDCNINETLENSSSSLHFQEQQQEEEPLSVDDDQRVYLVPFRWWKEAQESSSSEVNRGIFYAVSSAPPYGGAMKIFNNIFNLDIAFNLRKEDDSSLNSGAGATFSRRLLMPRQPQPWQLQIYPIMFLSILHLPRPILYI
ncbi:ubiquitin-specific protease 8 [Abeliophyllum distichum]|uniref:Ubiquitin-specific protease 8 n=1 Tax=Abeliophyllum distichum TaxID=126358 RepID=A0ABD1QIR8_9LAMI